MLDKHMQHTALPSKQAGAAARSSILDKHAQQQTPAQPKPAAAGKSTSYLEQLTSSEVSKTKNRSMSDAPNTTKDMPGIIAQRDSSRNPSRGTTKGSSRQSGIGGGGSMLDKYVQQTPKPVSPPKDTTRSTASTGSLLDRHLPPQTPSTAPKPRKKEKSPDSPPGLLERQMEESLAKAAKAKEKTPPKKPQDPYHRGSSSPRLSPKSPQGKECSVCATFEVHGGWQVAH